MHKIPIKCYYKRFPKIKNTSKSTKSQTPHINMKDIFSNGFSKRINHYSIGWDMFQGYLLLCNNVLSVVKTDIYVFGSTMVFRILTRVAMLSLKIVMGSSVRVVTFRHWKNLLNQTNSSTTIEQATYFDLIVDRVM